MSPIIEMHLIQSLQPNNLNRDDTGSPKSTVFGGTPRRRISSQSIKRAQRRYFAERNLIDAADLGIRSKRIAERIALLLREEGKAEEQAEAVARTALLASGFGIDKGTKKTEYLLFVSAAEVQKMAEEAAKRFDELVSAAEEVNSKDAAKKKLSEDTRRAFQDILGLGKAVDLALFGRMLADLPEKNVEAACHVAHAISTHAVDEEWDYYTAVDDLKPDDTSGADMIGSIGFSSCCVYRYQSVDTSRLAANLGGDTDLARSACAALLQAIVHALPTGKQATLASPNPPSTVMTVVREHGSASLANAFLRPVRADERTEGLEELSLGRLVDYWDRLQRMYGSDGILGVHVATLYPETLGSLVDHSLDTVADLIDGTLAHTP